MNGFRRFSSRGKAQAAGVPPADRCRACGVASRIAEARRRESHGCPMPSLRAHLPGT
jgi:hypothetical protein